MASSAATPLVVYVVHHPECTRSEELAKSLFTWFRLHGSDGDRGAAGVPVYFRRALDKDGALTPGIKWEEAALSVVVALVGHRVVGDPRWLRALIELSDQVRAEGDKGRAVLLPVALHDAFYRTGRLYEQFNPVRLFDVDHTAQPRVLRRAATEATARALRGLGEKTQAPPPLDVFLSHAKADGKKIAEALRDGVRRFGQLVPWYDANDLPHGAAWEPPMTRAVGGGTAAMLAVVTDAYPSRPWCRMEATLARTPQPVEDGSSNVWTVQPVVAIHWQRAGWSGSLSMLDGVPRTGWGAVSEHEDIERIVDRLVLEALLIHAHRRVALHLSKQLNDPTACFLTWVPDLWTLTALRGRLPKRARVKHLVYPGHGLRVAERQELTPVLNTFGEEVGLHTYEELWPPSATETP
jgi:hypothetical protein